ncbi:MAG: hypothetical protein UY41_C0034G0009 [Candidatus Moranbacteria bacterium GW2011_GWE1_49_15]|nr:MAG: hypothetical protein UY41_C0034G0009 [Candidatus Moranbacteria bacterium GW2011_GWE1_49_15]
MEKNKDASRVGTTSETRRESGWPFTGTPESAKYSVTDIKNERGEVVGHGAGNTPEKSQENAAKDYERRNH